MASTPRFALLGPLEARVDGALVDLGGMRTRSVLAALLLDANRVVTVDRLIDAAWGEAAPPTARTQVQNRLSVLRRAFASSGAQFIDRVGSGYVARLRDDQLDLSRFSIQSAQAELLAAHGDLDGAHAAFTAALALWRGPALDGLTTPQLERSRISWRNGGCTPSRVASRSTSLAASTPASPPSWRNWSAPTRTVNGCTRS